ncbi:MULTISPECIES: hypothetical protein [unclassified Streptomyces]|uniref:hypothetical protein n=1 Tax=unclassified Streptomyces TaxID=2593676 RepID=UPI002476E3F9|nr:MULTISPECIES: hypothetical protein [unclassified Streptomyces]MDH6455960.1 hypothetical protein [Streptomyces sp. SAI-119]MDH6502112.1 hypothetical protein [Streptomyces sp. SAI-149]
MHLRKRVLALVFVATAAFTALGPQAMAAPVPRETSKTPAAVTHHSSTAAGERGTVTLLCAPPCYQ